MKKALFKLFIVALAISGVSAILLLYNDQQLANKIHNKLICSYTLNFTSHYTRDNKTINEDTLLIKIPINTSITEIFSLLKKQHVIPQNEELLLCFLKESANEIKAGYIEIPPATSYSELISKLKTPLSGIKRLTIAEGMRADQISQLAQKTISNKYNNFSGKKLLQLVKTPPKSIYKQYTFLPKGKPLEGFLFPDTYEINTFEITETEFLHKLLQTFQEKALPLLHQSSERHKELGLSLSMYQKLILASIVERETTKNITERQMVADILLKRLSINMPLQTDATLLYPKKDWRYRLTYEDIQKDNPYNTYTRYGLPPTPISNPGISAIKAVVTPKPNPYYYYLHDNYGKIYYATSYAEHIKNINQYLYPR